MLLPVAAFSGWCLAKGLPTKKVNCKTIADAEYYIGLSFLLQNETDKAVDHLIKMLEVNSETVELHLALALLFRKKGEVDRSIRIHQNILARQDIPQTLNDQVLYELGLDYYSAGLLDRAEQVFSDLEASEVYRLKALKFLTKVYEKEKNWLAAIASTQQYINHSNQTTLTSPVSHYHCELAIEHIENDNFNAATIALKAAYAADTLNIRVNVIEADLLIKQEKYEEAIEQLLEVPNKNGLYLSEIIDPLIVCYDAIEKKQGYAGDLCTKDNVVLLANKGRNEAVLAYIEDNVEEKASFQILRKYVTLLQTRVTDPEASSSFAKVNCFLNDLSDKSGSYLCKACGYAGNKLFWKCPSCENWDSLKPI